MPDPIASESPLARFDLAARSTKDRAGAGVVAHERAFLGHLNLRGDAQDPQFAAAVSRVLGVLPPIAPNTVAEAQDRTVYWLGPDEWLVVTAGEGGANVEGSLRAALTGMHAAVTDVSGGQTVLVLSGNHARDLLAKGCPLDLHRRKFDVGRCAQSHLAKAPILIRQLDRDPTFEIVVRRSFADYLWLWLEDAAAEYSLAATA